MGNTEDKKRAAHLAGILLGRYEISTGYTQDALAELEELGRLSDRLGYAEESGAITEVVALLKDGKTLNQEQATKLKRHITTVLDKAQRFSFRSFVSWSINVLAVVAAIITIFQAVGFDILPKISLDGSFSDNGSDTEDSLTFVYIIQLSIISLIYIEIITRFRKQKIPASNDIVAKTIKQFIGYYSTIWLSWIVLYICLTLIGRYDHIEEGLASQLVVFLSVMSELANNVSSFAFIMCFVVLDQPSVELKRGDQRNLTYRRLVPIFLATVIILTCISTLPFWGDSIFNNLHHTWKNASSIPAGTVAGICMCYFIGRLDSKFFEANRILIGLLYGYAVIQFAWPLFELEGEGGTDMKAFPDRVLQVIMLASLIGKLVLWKIVDSVFARDEHHLREYLEWAHERLGSDKTS